MATALLTDRARLSKLETYNHQDNGASFLGSGHFPNDLVRLCTRIDPKGLLFGISPIVSPSENVGRERLRRLLEKHIGGKRILVCSGGKDKVVPYRISQPFVEFLEQASRTWCADAGILMENKIYDGVGHEFSREMVQDAIAFLLDAVADKTGSEPELDAQKSKI
jgi:hypothetical protein